MDEEHLVADTQVRPEPSSRPLVQPILHTQPLGPPRSVAMHRCSTRAVAEEKLRRQAWDVEQPRHVNLYTSFSRLCYAHDALRLDERLRSLFAYSAAGRR